MIQPQELRLGSVLNYWIEEEKTFVPTRVDWQDLMYISEVPKGFNDSHKPIPLTEEILLKCGFYSPRPGCWHHREIKGWFTKYTEESGVYAYQYNIFQICEFKYLHQLQNLFHALTGQELEIKL